MTKNKEGARRPPTETDVAKLAGVSQSAVSRSFTPGASVAENTRKKILEAADELGYQPNLLARSLVTNKSNIIALAISHLENPFYAQVVKELSEQLRATGRHILLYTTPSDQETDPALERVLSYRIDGLILAATKASTELRLQCLKSGVPIVQINRETQLPAICTVRGENRRVGEQVAEFFLAGGHKRFAFIGGTAKSGTSRVRQEGYVDTLKAHGIDDVQITQGDYTFEAAALAAHSLLSWDKRPDAIFCTSDYTAFAVLDVAKRGFGLKVPQDISVVGVDDVPEASHAVYDLTTFSLPASALVAEAIQVLDLMIENPGRRAVHREVSGELIIRGSAKLPPNIKHIQDN
ncbi:MAG: LacI family DNA-binding transcriptional regulator [Rhizobiales bacterium]|nr:LacI family DNA-binding transcriptional regulator [Hyphomicrobiales bacterium]